MKHTGTPVLVLIALLLLPQAGAVEVPTPGGNPILPGMGMADAHAVVHGDRVFVYAGHDHSPANKTFVMKEWWVWSSSDLTHWRREGTLQPEDTFIKRPFNDCWAGFCTARNGKHYWYFSAGPTEIGVVESSNPAGPWKDPLGKPLIAKDTTPTEARDPDILLDDDGQAYMVYGTFDYFIVRLNPDMISLAEAPRPVQLDRKSGPYGEGKTDDKPSLHKRAGIYYLSWSGFYAMSRNIYGPYTYKGTVITPETTGAEFQVDKASRDYDLWHDRHGNFFMWRNQWYYIFNDKSQAGSHTHFRDTCIAYVHYRDNGEIAPIRLDRIGVGHYDALQPQVEAEDYSAAALADVKECPDGGFEVRGLKSGSQLVYPNIKGVARNATITFRLASHHPGGGTIAIREGNANGRLLGTCAIPDTGGWNKYQTASCKLNRRQGTTTLCLVVQDGNGELLRLDWLKFPGANTP